MKDFVLEGELRSLRDVFAYNGYVRKKYLDILKVIPVETLKKDAGASFPTILDVFVHVLDVYRCWFLAYEKGEECNRWRHANKTGELIPPELRGLSLAEVSKIANEVEIQVDLAMRKLVPEDLSRSFRFADELNETKKERNVGDMLWHLVEEELQHRGEMNALLWQSDIEPPVTSWFTWRRESFHEKHRLSG